LICLTMDLSEGSDIDCNRGIWILIEHIRG
jgi:hypothetical protein